MGTKGGEETAWPECARCVCGEEQYLTFHIARAVKGVLETGWVQASQEAIPYNIFKSGFLRPCLGLLNPDTSLHLAHHVVSSSLHFLWELGLGHQQHLK